jgi:uncharacterized membrane protein
MTETVAQAPANHAHIVRKPATDAQAIRDTHDELHHLHEHVAQIKERPQEHHPKLVLSEHVRGSSILDKIADGVNVFCGSMYVFLFITVGIVGWLVLGPVIGFDKVPWPLLLTILNLPQLSIMVSLQVSANRAQAASDKRAIADHETLIALHTMAAQQIDILHKQDAVLGILQQFASHDMPGRQERIQETVGEILAAVRAPGGETTAGGAVPAS